MEVSGEFPVWCLMEVESVTSFEIHCLSACWFNPSYQSTYSFFAIIVLEQLTRDDQDRGLDRKDAESGNIPRLNSSSWKDDLDWGCRFGWISRGRRKTRRSPGSGL